MNWDECVNTQWMRDCVCWDNDIICILLRLYLKITYLGRSCRRQLFWWWALLGGERWVFTAIKRFFTILIKEWQYQITNHLLHRMDTRYLNNVVMILSLTNAVQLKCILLNWVCRHVVSSKTLDFDESAKIKTDFELQARHILSLLCFTVNVNVLCSLPQGSFSIHYVH